jgi:pimeloyl-ACP methyl ester carboxylesterase
MPYTTSDGCNIFLDLAGRGTPVLLLHGFSLDHRQWDPQWRAFADAHQSFRMDLRGHGRSAAGAGAPSYAAMARDVQRVLVQIGVDRHQPGFIVAHSLSADAALQAALAEPRSLRGVVVVTPAVWGQEWSEGWTALWRQMQALARAGDVAGALERFRGDALFAGLRDRPEALAAVRTMQAACSGVHLLPGERHTGTPTLQRLADCKVPVLVLSGARDRQDFRQSAAAVAARLPQAEHSEFADAGHFPNLEAPAPFTAKVLEFLSRHS